MAIGGVSADGRVRNNSSKVLTELRIRIYVNMRGKLGEVEDEAVVDISTNISPASVGFLFEKKSTDSLRKFLGLLGRVEGFVVFSMWGK